MLAISLLAFARSVVAVGSSPADAPAPVRAEFAALTGRSATFCGAVRVRTSRAAAVACGRAASTAGKPFWVLFERQGTDSSVWEGAALDPSGRYWALFYDSAISCGMSGEHRLGLSRCSRLRLARFHESTDVCREMRGGGRACVLADFIFMRRGDPAGAHHGASPLIQIWNRRWISRRSACEHSRCVDHRDAGASVDRTV